MITPHPTQPIPLTLNHGVLIVSGRVRHFYEQHRLDLEVWKPVAGPFFPDGKDQEDDRTLERFLGFFAGTWTILVKTSGCGFALYRHYSEMDPFIQKSGAVFARPEQASWKIPYAEYWAEKGRFKVG